MEAASMSTRTDAQTATSLTAHLIVALIMLLTTAGCEVENAVTHDSTEATFPETAELPQTQITRKLLDESLGLGRRFLLARQTPHGDFR